MKIGNSKRFLYHSFEKSWLGRVLNSYEPCPRYYPSHSDSNRKTWYRSFRLSIAKGADNSRLFSLLDRSFRWLFSRSLRSVGWLFGSFGIYSGIFWLFNYFIHLRPVDNSTLFYAGSMLIFSIPFFFSLTPIYEALKNSWIGHILQKLFGVRFGNESVETKGSQPALGVVFGLLAAVASFWISIPVMWLIFGAVFLLCLIFRQPETGAPIICLMIPFFPTMALVALVSATLLALALKAVRGKRILQLEKVDFYVAVYGFFTLLGGVTSITSQSIFPALVYALFLFVFFLFVTLMVDRTWIKKCMSTLLLGAGIVSALGIVQYFLGNYVGSAAWLDQSLFGDISLRAVSTLENPNMLGEYLVLLSPLALCAALHSQKVTDRFFSWVLLFLMIGCLGVTFSRGAWLGAIAAFTVMICAETKHVYPILIMFGVSIPLYLWVIPDVFIKRLESIFLGGDSSIQYRLNIWRGTFRMLKDFFWGGIGAGESAWEKIYPSYALEAIESAPHSHNLFLQILCEAGVFALLAFITVLLVIWQSSKSARRKMNLSCELKEMTKGQFQRAQEDISRIRAFGCGAFGACVFGLFDYAWYNYRVYLLFWVVLALCSASARVSLKEMKDEALDMDVLEKADEAEIDLVFLKKGEEHDSE